MKSCTLHPGKSRRNGFFSTLKWKLIFTSVLCTAAVSLFGSLFLYYKMNTMLQQKADRIDELHLSTLSDQLNEYLEDLSDLGNLCANDVQVVTALEQTGRSSYAMRQALDAQNRLNAYLASSPLSSTVDQLTVFNTDGRFISGAGRTMGTPQDYDLIIQQPLYQKILQMQNPPAAMIDPAQSIHMAMRRDPYVLAIVCPVRGLGSTSGYGYLYAELGLDLFSNVLEPFDEWSKLFLATDDTVLICPESLTEEEMPTARQLAQASAENTELLLGDRKFKVTAVRLNAGGLSLYSCFEMTGLDNDGAQTRMAVATTLLSCFLLALVLALLLAAYLTKPISLLNNRLHRIADNDFSYDPEIEKAGGELGQIGHTVNEMTMSIENLLQTTEQSYEQRRKIEIQLLQSQVNPHFLYNTLDSIRWMAVIQKSPGIESMTRSLSNLLKNIAKGTQDKITLEEELALLHDYVEIQSVRYMEVFTFHDTVPKELYRYRIIKLTLQPLVENAIFHGLETKAENGKVTIWIYTTDQELVVVISDNGTGIDWDTLVSMRQALEQTEEYRESGDDGSTHGETAGMDAHGTDRIEKRGNGIALSNVNQRIQLAFGNRYGLRLYSTTGIGTDVEIWLPKKVDRNDL